jgi:catechol 2,3-dioxygenase-like lactoylglutathione lyase family enzyme
MSAVAVRASAFLHHLQLQSPKPEKLAAFYGDAMQMSVEKLPDGRWHCFGPQRHVLIAPGEARGFDFSAFGCRDASGLAELREHATLEGLEPADMPSPLLDHAFSVRDPDGNGAVFGLAREGLDEGRGLRGPLQHVTLATFDVATIESFYAGKLGFLVSDRVVNDNGETATSFMRSNHEHHTLACFLSSCKGLDHHSYEAGEWDTIRDWADRFAEREIRLMWGPGRHGPGNNLFIFIEDPDGNWIEVSAELEVIRDRPVKHWPHGERTLNLWGNAILRS